jgi:hypothetical protein
VEYNTQRDTVLINEYGRNIHNMVHYLMTITDKPTRQRNAESVVEIMAILNQQMKGVEDIRQKYWDHLFVISDYKLDVDSPYGMPEREAKEAKPEPLEYPGNKIRWNHLGKNVEILLQKAKQATDPDVKKGYAQVIGNYIKVAYKNYHEDSVTDEAVNEELMHMTNGELSFEAGEFKRWVDGTLNESVAVSGIRNHTQNKNYGSGTNNRNGGGKFKNKFNKNFKRR